METTGNNTEQTVSPAAGAAEAAPESRLLGLVGRNARYVALLAAWIATCGSLYMSEVLGWVPCVLCWYQRILMYPLAILIPVGILRRDSRMHTYVLALSVPGMFLSLYHYLYQKTDVFRGMVPCTVGVPCSSDYLNAFGGVVTIPFLALVAFAIVSISVIAARLGSDPYEEDLIEPGAEDAPRPSLFRRAIPVLVIVGAVVVGYIVAGASYRSSAASTASAGLSTTSPLPTPDSAALAQGKVLYEQSCAACHGLSGEGTPAGRPLSNSALVQTGSDAELLKLVRVGRSVQDPHNTTGLTMPAGGGQTSTGDAELAAIVGYLRTLAGKAR